MPRDYIHDGPARVRFNLAGDLETNDATRPEQDCRTGFSTIGDRTLIIDLSAVTTNDETARSLFARCYAGKAEFSSLKRSRELVESMTECPLTEEPPHAPSILARPSPSIWNAGGWQ